MEAFEKIQHKGEERQQALALAAQRTDECFELMGEARAEGYSVAAIARAMGITQAGIYKRWDGIIPGGQTTTEA